MIQVQGSQLCDLPTLARRLGVSQKWLRDECQAGRLPHLPADGRRLLFNQSAVEAKLAERAAVPAQQ